MNSYSIFISDYSHFLIVVTLAFYFFNNEYRKCKKFLLIENVLSADKSLDSTALSFREKAILVSSKIKSRKKADEKIRHAYALLEKSNLELGIHVLIVLVNFLLVLMF